MRPIEFRGKAFGEFWFYGSLLIKKEINPKNKGQYIARYYITSDKLYNSEVEVRQTTIGQYTGLKDKNGKKIFEGDIVKHRGYNGMQTSVVKFEAGAFIVGYHDGSSTKRRPMLLQDKVEVIGNIHERKD